MQRNDELHTCLHWMLLRIAACIHVSCVFFLLQGSKPITIVNGSGSKSGWVIVAVPVALGGYLYMVYLKGWRISDMFYVTRSSFEKLKGSVNESFGKVYVQLQQVGGWVGLAPCEAVDISISGRRAPCSYNVPFFPLKALSYVVSAPCVAQMGVTFATFSARLATGSLSL